MDDYDTAQTMVDVGGSFVKLLALTWFKGDASNKGLIQATWPEYWAKYAKIARERQGKITSTQMTRYASGV